MRLVLLLSFVALLACALGCGGEAGKGKNSERDRPKPAPEKPAS